MAASLLLAACGGEPKKAPAPAPAPAAPEKTDVTTLPEYKKGQEIIAKNDCLACHKIEEKLVGPSYKDVAKKYAAQADAAPMLAEKIKKGGKGVWGEVEMAAHPNLSKEDALALAQYVLLFKE